MRQPLIGSGLDTFGPRFVGAKSWFGGGVVAGRSAHNDLLNISVGLGVVGALLYLVFVGCAVVRPLRARPRMGSSQLRALPLMVWSLLLLWIGCGFTSDVYELKPFWLLIGLSYAFSRASYSAGRAQVRTVGRQDAERLRRHEPNQEQLPVRGPSNSPGHDSLSRGHVRAR